MNRKKRLLCLLLILALLILLFAINREPGYISVIEANWGLTFPQEANWKLFYETDSGPSFHGDGWRYHIFTYKQEAPVFDLFTWSKDSGKNTVFQKTYREEAEFCLDQLNVSSELRPDYENCLCWYAVQDDNSQILIFLDPAQQRVFVVENFI